MNTLLLLIFPAMMALAAFSDLFTMKISNRLVMVLAAAFFPLAFVAGLSLGAVGMHLALGAGVLAATFAMFAAGWIGGGDAKLAAATALWLGPELALTYFLYASLLGGALTLALLVARTQALPVRLVGVEWIARLHHRKTGIPYGIALAAAGLLVYEQAAIFRGLV